MLKMIAIIAALSLNLKPAFAKEMISGSDTLAGVMSDAIIAAGMDKEIAYTGGGSGVGEKALVAGEIGLTAMSRELKPEAVAQLQAAGAVARAHVIGLDGLVILTNASNSLAGMDLSLVVRIFKCEVTSWNQVPGSNRTGPINVVRRDDKSGTTDTFKHLTGLKAFGPCVTVMTETRDIADKTATDANAIGYAGKSGLKAGNHALKIASAGSNNFIEATDVSIRNETYPLSRKLFVYSIEGSRRPTEVESRLLENLLDRSFLDPILQSYDFVTLD